MWRRQTCKRRTILGIPFSGELWTVNLIVIRNDRKAMMFLVLIKAVSLNHVMSHIRQAN